MPAKPLDFGGERLRLLHSRQSFLRSMQKKFALRPHFFKKMVSQGQVFLYRPQMPKLRKAVDGNTNKSGSEK